MVIALLVALIAFEGAFAAIATRKRETGSRWLQLRFFASLAELALVALAVFATQGAPGMRFTAILAALALRAGANLVCYLVKRNRMVSAEPIRASRAIRSAIRSSLIIAIALAPAFLFADYEGLPTSGEHEVAQASAILIDPSRTDPYESDGSAREIPAHFYYPADAGAQTAAQGETHPLIVFSHGAFGYYQSNYSLYAELASHGYVVVALDYPHHAFVTQDTNGNTIIADRGFLQSAMAAQGGQMESEEEFTLTHEWLALRTADLNFVLDTLEDASEASFDDRIWWFPSTDDAAAVADALAYADTNLIGLAGHSLGGATSVEVGRTRSDVDAVIDVDGTMFGGELAYNGGDVEFDTTPYPVPLLSIDNEDHYRTGVELGSSYVNNVVLDNAVDSTHTYFVGSGHLNFTDLPLFSPALASLLGTGPVDAQACIEQMNAIALQFFDYHLRGIGSVDSIAECYEPGA